VALHSQQAAATAVSSAVNLPNGSFSTTLSGTGSATITGASGNYRDWTSLGFFGWQSVNVGLSASNQTVGVSMPNVNIANSVASGSANITFDDVTPPTEISLDSLNADLNGVGGSNQNYNFSINISPMTVNIGGLGNASLALAMSGMITNATFTSTGGSPANSYAIPGNLDLTIQGAVTGSLNNILGLGINVGLGTLYTLAPTTFSIATVLPGNMLLTDLSGGVGPFPASMGVDLSAALPFSIPVPLSLPFDTNQSFPQVGHNDQITSLVINPGSALNVNLSLGNPSYDLNGTLPNVLVPEPSTIAMGSMGLVALTFFGFRRRKSA
jgi:hypothetical protein